MSTIKKILAILLSAVLCLAAFTALAESSETPVTINFWHHYSAQSAENETLMNDLIPKFESENPGIKVNAVSHEWAELHDKILVSASSQSLPDVARCDIAWLPEFQKMGVLVALDEAMPDFADVSDTLLDSAMSTAKIGGHYYALALNTNSKILFYNTAMLEAANVAVPTTMDEWVAAVRALSGTNANGQQVWGWNEPALSGWNICPFIWSFGGSLTNEDQTVATGYINSEATVKAVDTFAALVKEGALTGFNSGDIPMTDGFGTGRYAMMLEGPWKTAELSGAYPDVAYGTAPHSCGRGRQRFRAGRRGHCHVQHRQSGSCLEVHAVHDQRIRRDGDGSVRPDPRQQGGAGKRYCEERFLRALHRGHSDGQGPAYGGGLERDGQRTDQRHDRRCQRRKDRSGSHGRTGRCL